MSDASSHPLQTEALMEEGYAALRDARLEEALTLAAELRLRRHSSTFEIEARARWESGERDAAIAVLEEGVAKAPNASPLWHWLACYRSELGRYDQALEAFSREAEFEEVSPSANAYNVAVVYERMRRPADALDLIGRVERPEPPGPSRAHFAELRARLLFDLRRFEEAIHAATDAVDQFHEGSRSGKDKYAEDDAPPPADRAVLAGAYASRAAAKLETGDVSGATEDAARAIDLNSSHAPARAVDVLRRVNGQNCAASGRAPRRYTLVFEGELPGDKAFLRLGFFVSMQVVAEDPAEGLEFARRFVPQAARPGLKIAEVTKEEAAAAGELKGVCSCGLLRSFDPDAPDDDGGQ